MANKLSKVQIQNVLGDLSKNGIISNNFNQQFDHAIIKQLANCNIIKKNKNDKSCHQTHIHITGDEVPFFPYNVSVEYTKTGKNKIYQTIDVLLDGENLDYLKDEDNHSDLNTEVTCYVREGKQKSQIQLSKLDSDGVEFLNFRDQLFEDDYIIMLKNNDLDRYIFLGIKSEENLPVGVFY